MKQSRHRFNMVSDVLEAFMPTMRMFIVSACCISIGLADDIAHIQTNSAAWDDYTFESLRERILDGPNALSFLDKIAYFVVLALALEIFNQIAIRLGGTLSVQIITKWITKSEFINIESHEKHSYFFAIFASSFQGGFMPTRCLFVVTT